MENDGIYPIEKLYNNVNSLYVAKSTDGGAKFGDPKLVSSGGTIQ